MVDTKERIEQLIEEAKPRLSAYGVRSLGLFGSFERGEQTADSDIDILIEFTPEAHTFDNFMEISFLLEDLLGRKVDLVTREALSPHIGPHILREVKLVHVTR